jgi:hypothetical protein
MRIEAFMSGYLLTLVLIAPRLAEAVVFVIAAVVAIWSGKAVRRADARRLLRLLRTGGPRARDEPADAASRGRHRRRSRPAKPG